MSNLPVFEAVMVAGLLLVSIVIAFPPGAGPWPTQPTSPTRHALQALVDDLIHRSDAFVNGDYDTLLNRVVIESLNGNASSVAALRRALGNEHVLLRLTLHAPDGSQLVLHEDLPPGREQVSATVLYVPMYDEVLVVPDVDHLDGGDMALPLTAIPIRNGFGLGGRDVPLVVTAELDGPTLQAGQGVRVGHVSQVTLGLLYNGRVTNWLDDEAATEFTVRINATGGEPVPAGERLRLVLPHAWSGIELRSAGWHDVALAAEPDGWVLQARSNASLAATADVTFDATPPDAVNAAAESFYALRAEFADSSAVLVVEGKVQTATLAAPFTRSLHVSVPSLLAPGATSAWSAVVANADWHASARGLDGGCVTHCAHLRAVTIQAPEGQPLFAAVGAPWSLVDAATLRWAGNASIAADDALELRAEVTTTGWRGGVAWRPSLQLSFPEQPAAGARNLSAMVDSATFHGRFGAETTSPGYPKRAGPHEACLTAFVEDRTLRGCARYHVSSLPALRATSDAVARGLEGSHVKVLNGTRLAPGQWVDLEADFTHLTGNLVSSPDFLGARDTTIRVLYPWTERNASTERWPVLQRFDTPADLARVQFQLPPGIPYGTYLVAASKGVDLIGGGDVDQVVRRVTWFTVGEGLAGPGTIYMVTLAAWLPDWT